MFDFVVVYSSTIPLKPNITLDNVNIRNNAQNVKLKFVQLSVFDSFEFEFYNHPIIYLFVADTLEKLSELSKQKLNIQFIRNTIPVVYVLVSNTNSSEYNSGMKAMVYSTNNMEGFFNVMFNEIILPFIEHTITNINEKILNKKFNRFLTFGKKYLNNSSNLVTNNGLTYYVLDSNESQLKRLADYSLLLNDYKVAYTCLDSLVKDFTLDKAHRYLANTYELLSLAGCHLNRNTNEIYEYMNSATDLYLQCELDELVTRCALAYKQMYFLQSSIIGLPKILLKATLDKNEKKNALMLLDCSAYYKNVGSVYKQIFFIVLSAQKYYKVGDLKNALKCCTEALELAKKVENEFLLYYFNLEIAKIENSVEYYYAALAYPKYFAEKDFSVFIQLLKKSNLEQLNINLEFFAMDSFQFKTKRELVDIDDAEFVEKSSGRIECSTGEEFSTFVTNENPFRFPVLFDKIDLFFNASGSASPLKSSLYQIRLEANETKIVEFKSVSSVQCELTLDSIEFVLAGDIRHRVKVKRKGKRLNETKEQRFGSVYADASFTISVIEPMPLLDIYIENLEESLRTGQILKCFIRVKNNASKMNSLWVKSSHPQLFYFGSLSEFDLGLNGEQVMENANNQINVSSVKKLECKSIAHGETVLIPMWLNACQVGNHQMSLLFKYTNTGRHFRYAKKLFNITVYHSLRTKVLAFEYSKDAFTAVINAENKTTEPITLNSIDCISPYLKLQGIDHPPTILPNTNVNIFVHLAISAFQKNPIVVRNIQRYLLKEPKFEPFPSVTLYATSTSSPSFTPLYSTIFHHSRSHYKHNFLSFTHPLLLISALPSLFPLYAPYDFDLIINYSLSSLSGRLVVHHSPSLPPLIPSRTLHSSMLKFTSKALLESSAKKTKQIYHNLIYGGMQKPFLFQLCQNSTFVDKKSECKLVVVNISEERMWLKWTFSESEDYVWSGETQLELDALEKKEIGCVLEAKKADRMCVGYWKLKYGWDGKSEEFEKGWDCVVLEGLFVVVE